MSLPIITIRPEPGCAATVAAARALGLEAHGFPLFATRALAWEPPDPAQVDALLIGSANAPRLAGAALARYAGKPAYAVGEATARAAREAGLQIAAIGSAGSNGGLGEMLGGIAPAHRRLLRLAGRERVELVPADGITLTERVVYASEPQPIPEALARLLSTRALPRVLVLLHSAEAARHFAAECDRLGIARARIHLVALGPRIAAAAGQGWSAIATAEQASDQALLALCQRLCQ